MAGTTHIAVAQRNSELDGSKTNWDNGYLRFYGTSMPANPETAPGGSVLAELRFSAGAGTGMGTASGGTSTAGTITQDSSADNSGTALWARALRSDGTTVIGDFSVGTSGEVINMNTNVIVAGGVVQVSSFTYTQPM